MTTIWAPLRPRTRQLLATIEHTHVRAWELAEHEFDGDENWAAPRGRRPNSYTPGRPHWLDFFSVVADVPFVVFQW